jgi:hypothetical protein
MKCPLDRKKTKRLFDIIVILGIIAFTVTLLIYIHKGFASRYWADDYCFSAFLKIKGFFGGLNEFYSTTSNRFGAYFLVAVSEVFGSTAIQFLPGFVIILLIVGCAWNYYSIFGLVKLTDSKLIALLFALISVFFLLLEAPNLFQSVYWRSGMVSYFAPLVLFAFITGCLLWLSEDKKKVSSIVIIIAICSILAFIAAGTSETYAAFQTSFLVFFLLFWFVFKRKNKKYQQFYVLIGVIITSFIAMLIMVAAPGNHLRMDLFHQAGDLGTIFQLSVTFAFDFISQSLRGLPIPIGVCFGIVFILAYHLSAYNNEKIMPGKTVLWLIIIPLIAFILIIAICAPTVYGMLTYPEERVLMIARFVMVIAGVFWAGAAGIGSHIFMDRIVDTCLVSIVILGLFWVYPIRESIRVWNSLSTDLNRAVIWDRRQDLIFNAKIQGQLSITIPAMNSIEGVSELSFDPQFWVNQCAAQYYGLNSIIAIEK